MKTAKAKKPRPADISRAKGYVERVKALIEQQKELGSDISDVCTEAKENAGLDPTTIRFAARESLMDEVKRADRDDKRAQYLHAVGLAVEAVRSGEVSARQAAKIYSIGKTSVYNALAVREVSAPIEMTDDDLGAVEPVEPTVEMTTEDLGTAEPVREMIGDDLGDPLWIVDKDRARFREKVRAAAASVQVTRVVEPSPPPRVDPEDTLEIPAFLKRHKSDPVSA